MSLTILLVLVVIFSFAVGHLITRYAASRHITLAGAEYVLVGALIGPQIPPRLLSPQALAQLEPLVSLLIGLVGFVLGLRARGPRPRLAVAAVGVASTLGVMLVVSLACLSLAGSFLPTPDEVMVRREIFRIGAFTAELYVSRDHLQLALALGAAASTTSAAMVDAARARMAARGRVGELLGVVATSSEVAAVLALGLLLASSRAIEAAGQLGIGVAAWALASVGLGIVSGLLFSLFIGEESDAMRIFVASIGAVIFASGIGSALGISPLFVNLLAGATAALTSPHASRLREELTRLRHPLFVLLMIFAGAFWVPVSGWLWLMPAAYVAFRFAARRLLTAGLAHVLLPGAQRIPRIGNGLLGQGIVAVSIGLAFAERFPQLGPVVLTTVLVGALVSDLWSERALRAVLLDAGEFSPASAGVKTPAPEPSREAA